jgi:hypothetical protein
MADRDGDYPGEDFRHNVIGNHSLSAMSHWDWRERTGRVRWGRLLRSA